MGGDARSMYQAMISATTTAAAMISTLFVSIAPLLDRVSTRLPGFAGWNRSNHDCETGRRRQYRKLLGSSDENHDGAHTITATLAKPAHIGDPLVSIGTAHHADDSDHDVWNRNQKEANTHCIGQTAATAVMAAAVAATFAIVPLDDGIFPKSLAERDITSPECYEGGRDCSIHWTHVHRAHAYLD